MSQTETIGTGTVQGNLDALQAERDAEWAAERLAANRAVRSGLEQSADRAGIIAPGDLVTPFTLPEVDGGHVDLAALLKHGPVVLIFFRYESCQADNVALPAYRSTLVPALAELGATLVGVSPQAPEKLVAIKRRLDLGFSVASDRGARVIKQFGIGFVPTALEREAQRAAGSDLGEILGSSEWTLPYPTVVVIDENRIVRFADAHPDWMVRTEASTVIEAVRALA